MLDCRATDGEIAGHAIFSAGRVRTLLASIGKSVRPMTEAGIMGALTNIATACQAKPVQCDTVGGAVARMTDAGWWVRNVRRELLRENETQEHAAGAIHKAGQVYVSNHAAKAKAKRRKANRETLENLEVVNETGQAFNLQEVAEGSVSNPALRRAELMVRCRGFEEVAEFSDHKAIFLTGTCPSRFHRAYQSGAANPKWDGSTPKQAHAYLNKVWQKTRAGWKRAGAMPYGFRVAEPHHDSTPHWHILLFVPAEQVQGVIAIARRYFCADSPTERGMGKHRFTVKMIDPSQDSATGYIAKYICKNIDGATEGGGALEYSEKESEHGDHVAEDRAAQLVRDWATTWGIRQFQQVGGPSVTVWRELRRLREPVGGMYDPIAQTSFNFEGVRAAADESMWSMFWMLQGGPATPRAKLSIKPDYTLDGAAGKYGERVNRIIGLLGNGAYKLKTRLHEWKVQRAGLALVNVQDAEHIAWVKSNNRLRAFEKAMGVPMRPEVREFEPEPVESVAIAWTGVNNCTPPPATYHGTEAENAEEVENGQREEARINQQWEFLRKATHDNPRKQGTNSQSHGYGGANMGHGTHTRQGHGSGLRGAIA